MIGWVLSAALALEPEGWGWLEHEAATELAALDALVPEGREAAVIGVIAALEAAPAWKRPDLAVHGAWVVRTAVRPTRPGHGAGPQDDPCVDILRSTSPYDLIHARPYTCPAIGGAALWRVAHDPFDAPALTGDADARRAQAAAWVRKRSHHDWASEDTFARADWAWLMVTHLAAETLTEAALGLSAASRASLAASLHDVGTELANRPDEPLQRRLFQVIASLAAVPVPERTAAFVRGVAEATREAGVSTACALPLRAAVAAEAARRFEPLPALLAACPPEGSTGEPPRRWTRPVKTSLKMGLGVDPFSVAPSTHVDLATWLPVRVAWSIFDAHAAWDAGVVDAPAVRAMLVDAMTLAQEAL